MRATTWMNLKNILQSEIRQSQRPYIVWSIFVKCPYMQIEKEWQISSYGDQGG